MDPDHKPAPSIFRSREESRKAKPAAETESRALTLGRRDAVEERPCEIVETDRSAEPGLAGYQEKFDRQRAARQADFEGK